MTDSISTSHIELSLEEKFLAQREHILWNDNLTNSRTTFSLF